VTVLLRSLRCLMAGLFTALLMAGLVMPSEALATCVQDFPSQLPSGLVVDTADLLSRAASTDL